MKKVSRIWLWLFLLSVGFAGGIVVGVIVDVDTVYHTTVKKLKQKNSPGGTITVEVEPTKEPEPTRKEAVLNRREDRAERRAIRRATRKQKQK